MKLGIEFRIYFELDVGREVRHTFLYILDQYRLGISVGGLILEKINYYFPNEDIRGLQGISEKIIGEIKKHAKDKFGIEL